MKNDYVVLRHYMSKFNLKISVENTKKKITLTRIKGGANTLKVSKYQDDELVITYLEMSSNKFLTTFLYKMEEFNSQRLFSKAMEYIPDIYQAFSLMETLQDFLKN
jgi:hypothetical protein